MWSKARWVHYEKIKGKQNMPGNIMGIERGKRNSNDFIILTKAGCLLNNNKQEKSRFSTKSALCGQNLLS